MGRNGKESTRKETDRTSSGGDGAREDSKKDRESGKDNAHRSTAKRIQIRQDDNRRKRIARRDSLLSKHRMGPNGAYPISYNKDEVDHRALLSRGAQDGIRRQDQWGSWLNTLPWDYWATLTTRNKNGGGFVERPYTERSLGSAYGRWFKSQGTNKDGIELSFMVMEYGRQGGRLHAHALLKGTFDKDLAESTWYFRHGICQLEPFDNGKGAAYYLSKYLSKDVREYRLDTPPQGKLRFGE